MKYLFYLLLLLPFASCVSKSSADKLASEKDSLALVVSQKDSVVNDVFMSINAIAENLNVIKMRENIITKSIGGSGELSKQTTTQISEDIEAINNLLVENRATIEKLQSSVSKLKSANFKIAGLEKLVSQLESQIATKNQEISVLKRTIADMQINVAELNDKVDGLSSKVTGLTNEKSSLEGEVKNKTDIINTGYYIIGLEKELLSKEIVYKSGFIGRTLKINENRSLDSFTQVDIRDFDELVIGGKKATLVSSHPAESFELVASGSGKGLFESLKITDKKRFWEYSKVLVVSYK